MSPTLWAKWLLPAIVSLLSRTAYKKSPCKLKVLYCKMLETSVLKKQQTVEKTWANNLALHWQQVVRVNKFTSILEQVKGTSKSTWQAGSGESGTRRSQWQASAAITRFSTGQLSSTQKQGFTWLVSSECFKYFLCDKSHLGAQTQNKINYLR